MLAKLSLIVGCLLFLTTPAQADTHLLELFDYCTDDDKCLTGCCTEPPTRGGKGGSRRRGGRGRGGDDDHTHRFLTTHGEGESHDTNTTRRFER